MKSTTTILIRNEEVRILREKHYRFYVFFEEFCNFIKTMHPI